MTRKDIYIKIKGEITKGIYSHDDQMSAISTWVECEFEKEKAKRNNLHKTIGDLMKEKVQYKERITELMEWQDNHCNRY